MKKVIVILSLVFICGLGFSLYWGIGNYVDLKKVKSEYTEAYNEGYNNAFSNKEEYVMLLNSYKNTIVRLNTQTSSLQELVNQLQTTNDLNVKTIASLNTQLNLLNNQVNVLNNNIQELQATNDSNVATIINLNNQINTLNSQVNSLNDKIRELQRTVDFYEDYISSIETADQAVVTFEFDGSVYNVKIVEKGSTVTIDNPESTDYIIFNYWTIDGEQIDLNSYTFNSNTKIIANLTYRYDVVFKVDDVVLDSQIITKNATATVPNAPSKAGYRFLGWSINGQDIVENIDSIEVVNNTTYIAIYTSAKNGTYVCGTSKITIANEQIVSSDIPITEENKLEDGSYYLDKGGIVFKLYFIENASCWIYEYGETFGDKTINYFIFEGITITSNMCGTFEGDNYTLVIEDNSISSFSASTISEFHKQRDGYYIHSVDSGDGSVTFTLEYIEEIDCWLYIEDGNYHYLSRV